MKIKRSRFEAIVKEELIKTLQELREGEPEDEKDPASDEAPKAPKDRPAEKKPKAPSKGAPDASGGKEKPAQKGKAAPQKPAPKKGPEAPPMPAAAGGEGLPEVPDEPDPADDQLGDEMPADEPEEGGGEINSEIAGKTVQSITIEPSSKLLPGAKEVIFSFDQVADPLKVLVTATGVVKFFYRGKLSDIP